ncbi:MAG: hypothetical protein ACREEP_01740, partial [Dongiaceae bacterium]
MHDGATGRPANASPLDIDALIAVARGERSGEISAATATRLAHFQAAFDVAALPAAPPSAICFAFHASVPQAEAAVKYRDVAIDHSKFDYERIVRHCIATALAVQPGARFILATDSQFLGGTAHPALTVVRLPLDASSPMYERVLAMCAFVRSRQFNAPTAFLDGDAFLNAPIANLFQGHFDVGATYRPDSGLMPINEGVIFVDNRNKDPVRNFFAGYLGTYDRLCQNATVTGYYGNVKRWRGGQLSLNALTCPLGIPSELDGAKALGAKVRYFPCSTFNFSIELHRPYSAKQLDTKAVLHLKGPRKAVLDQIVSYQTQRWPQIAQVFPALRPPAPALAPVDRAYSLDTTAPVDYEPPSHIDYARASLTEIADHFKTDKGSIKHDYTAVYERYFGPLRTQSGLCLMEIGVACGSSLKMWSKYFHDARILGVDIRPDCAKLCRLYPNIAIMIQNATLAPVEGRFDIIIDDGSHVSADIVDTFRLNWPNLKAGGLFVVEDLKCTHNPQYRSLLPFDIPAERFDR